MKLVVKRKAKTPTYTIGDLFVDGVKFCNTLEDPDRGLSSDMPLERIRETKIYGNTAIPLGTYAVDMKTVSPKYSRKAAFSFTNGYMPRLVNVPGWTGVLLHSGNTAKDTLGCILVGNNSVKGMVTSSLDTFKRLYQKLKKASDSGEGITITIQ